jgi:site-specific DNA recombinase
MSKTKAIIYLRFSPRRDGELCESDLVQLDLCQAYCKQHGYSVVGIERDLEYSGDDENRDGLWKAMHALRRGMVLVVHKGDRLARGVYLSEYLRREIRTKKASVEVVEGSRNGSSPEDVFIRQVFDAYSELEKKIIARRTSVAMRFHQRNSRAMSKIAPIGQRRGQDKTVVDSQGKPRVRMMWEPDPEEVAAVERIKELREVERRNLHAIARALDAEGFVARGAKGWSHVSVRRVLQRLGLPTGRIGSAAAG